MKNQYKSALDKITLRRSEKEKAKALFHQVNTRKENNMKGKKIIKSVATVAASLALVLGIHSVIPVLQSDFGKTSDSSIEYTSAGNTNFDNITSSPEKENHFSVVVYAKELTDDGKVYPNDYHSCFYSLTSNTEDELSLGFDFPVECKGENIDTVTYSINQGAFHVVTAKGKSVVVDGEKSKKKWIGFSKLYDDAEDAFYQSYTVKYDNQTNAGTYIDIVDAWENWSEDKFNQYRDFHFDITDVSHDKATLEKRKEVFDFLTKDMGITCTVTYKDGTTETKNIEVSNEIVEPSKVIPDEGFSDDEGEDVVRCFSIR